MTAGRAPVHTAAMMSDPVDLDTVTLLAPLSPAERRRVAGCCFRRRAVAGETVVDKESPHRDVFFVLDGRVRVVDFSIGGREVALTDLGPGACFGELAAIDGRPRSANVVALAPTTLAVLRHESLWQAIETHPALARTLIVHLADMVRMSTARIVDLSTLGAHNRVQGEILRLAREAAGQGCATIRPAPVHADIASRVSTTRETVARVLGDLERQGVLERHRGALTVLDLEALEAMVREFRGA